MRWSDLLRMSVSSLRRRKLRTFLTVLGVVIGTASIVVMISLGLGLQESMYKEVEQNGGTTSITVTGKDSGGMMYGYSGMSSDEEESQKYITDDVIKELKNVAHVKSAEPIDRYVFSFSKHNAFSKFKLIIRSVIDHRNSQTSEPHIHRPYIFVSRAHRRSCLYVIRRIDHNHSRNRTHQSNIFITLMCRSVFTYGNSGMCCSDFYVQMRITD